MSDARRRLNWAVICPRLLGLPDGPSVRHTRGHTRCSVLLPFTLGEGARFCHHDERLLAAPGNSPHYLSDSLRHKRKGCEERFTEARRTKCANLNNLRPTSRKRSRPSSQYLEKRLSRQIGKRRGNDSNQTCWALPLPSSHNPMTSSQGKGPSWMPARVPQQCVLSTLLPPPTWRP